MDGLKRGWKPESVDVAMGRCRKYYGEPTLEPASLSVGAAVTEFKGRRLRLVAIAAADCVPNLICALNIDHHEDYT